MAKSDFPRKASSETSVPGRTELESALFGMPLIMPPHVKKRSVQWISRSTVTYHRRSVLKSHAYLTPAHEPVKIQKHPVAKHSVECKTL